MCSGGGCGTGSGFAAGGGGSSGFIQASPNRTASAAAVGDPTSDDWLTDALSESLNRLSCRRYQLANAEIDKCTALFAKAPSIQTESTFLG